MISGISSRKQMATIQNLNFVPTSISGLSLWLDAADRATLVLAVNTVTQWNDKSGNNRNMTTSAGTVTYANNTLTIPSGAVMTGPSMNFSGSIALVAQPTGNTGGLNMIIGRAGNDPSIRYESDYKLRNPGDFNDIGTGGSYVINGTQQTITNPALNTQNNIIYTPIVYTFTNTFSISNTYLSRYFIGTINEVIMYTSSLSNLQRQQIEGYLAWKWGLVGNLPSNHPFKLVAPNTAGLTYPTTLSVPIPTQSFSLSSSPLALFNPNSISGLTLWLDATRGIIANVWSDKSSSQNNVTRTGGTITTTTVNNVQAFSFTGVGMSYNNNLIFNGTTGSTCFFISAPSATTNNHLLSTSLGASSHFLFADGNLYEAIGFSSRQTISGLSFNTVQMYGNIANRGGNTLIFRNGTQIFSATYGSGYTPLTYSVAGWTGTVCEILVYTRTLLLSEQQQVEGYLAWKWGLQTSLPSNHPYRNILPGPYGIPITNISFQPASFRPTQFTGLLVWTDASTLGLANNATLLFWPNGGSQGTVNCTGTFLTNQLNGLPIVRLNTTQTWSIASQPTPSAYSLFFVTRQRGGTNERVLQATSGNSVYGYVGGRKNVLFIDGNPGFLTGSPSDSAWDLFSHTRTQNSAYTFNWNGTSSYSGASSANGPLTGLAINTGSFAAQASDCDVAEIILYNSVLSTQQVQQLEGYLAWKWGLQGNLPANHPFKRFLPPPS